MGRSYLPIGKHPGRGYRNQPMKNCPVFPFLIRLLVIAILKASDVCELAAFPIIWVHKGNTCKTGEKDALPPLLQTTYFSEYTLTGRP